MSLLSEIFEQPTVIRSLIQTQTEKIAEIARAIQQNDIRYIYLAARGSSDNAGKYAQYLFGAINHLPMALATPSLFSLYQQPPELKNALVVGISQSGMSPDILSVLEEGRRQGRPTLLITNSVKSPMAAMADHVLPIEAGNEKAVAATKTYTATLVSIAMLSAFVAGDTVMFEQIQQIPRWAEYQLEHEGRIAKLAEHYAPMERCVVLGRGYNYSTAYEWSLKMKELAAVMAEPFSSADFLHGPIAMVKGNLPVLAVVPQGKSCASMLELLNQLCKQQRGDIFSISNCDEILALSRAHVKIPAEIPEWLSPIVGIIPGQVFTYHLTRNKGMDPDQPVGLTKITETR